jgi:hypothetical protein
MNLLKSSGMKLIATRTLVWIGLVGLYAVSPIAGIAALAACFAFAARGKQNPAQERA